MAGPEPLDLSMDGFESPTPRQFTGTSPSGLRHQALALTFGGSNPSVLAKFFGPVAQRTRAPRFERGSVGGSNPLGTPILILWRRWISAFGCEPRGPVFKSRQDHQIWGCGRSDMHSAVYGNEAGPAPVIPAISRPKVVRDRRDREMPWVIRQPIFLTLWANR